MELLFESRLNLSNFIGQIRFVQNQPTVHPEPVLRADTFADRKGLSIYGSVHREGGKLRMWYQAMPEDWDYVADMAAVAYAESDDGIHWIKPALGQMECGGAPSNLLNLALHCPSIFIDPESPGSHRYRATGYSYPGLFMVSSEISQQGYYTAHSADGLHWNFDTLTPRWPGADIITSIYHPGQQRGIVALKYMPRRLRMGRRSVHTAEFRGGQYSDHVSALYPDEADDMLAAHRGYHSCDYYGMAMQGAGSGTVGFLWNYWHSLPYTGDRQAALYGTSDVTLVYQAEPGGRWVHSPGRPIFIDHTQFPWMNGWINTASCPVEMGDEHWLYFSGEPTSHGFYLDTDWQTLEKWTAWDTRHGAGSIGFARWPKWRLFGFNANPDGRFDIDLGELSSPAEVWLNFRAENGGRVRVEVQGDASRTFQECHDLCGDSAAQRVEWKNGCALKLTPGKRTVLTLHLEMATVFAYELRYL